MYVLDKNDKKQIPPRGIGTCVYHFRKTHHTTTQHTTSHPLPIHLTASLFSFPSLSAGLACPHPSVMLVSLHHCSMLYYATILHLYNIYNIYVILHTHSNTISLYYIYISILLVYLSIHYYIPILFYNQHSILHYHSISIYPFYCLYLYIYSISIFCMPLSIYISVLFLSACLISTFISLSYHHTIFISAF